MRALVVYESMFGNTKDVADAVAGGLRERLEVQVTHADDAPTSLAGWELAVVSGPTHAFGMSRASTRRSAVEEHGAPADVAFRKGLREWLAAVSGPDGLPVAAFDTKVAHPDLPGSAARKVAKRLRNLRFHLQAPPETFLVEGMTGPLVAGEIERARQWGAGIAAALAAGRPAKTRSDVAQT